MFTQFQMYESKKINLTYYLGKCVFHIYITCSVQSDFLHNVHAYQSVYFFFFGHTALGPGSCFHIKGATNCFIGISGNVLHGCSSLQSHPSFRNTRLAIKVSVFALYIICASIPEHITLAIQTRFVQRGRRLSFDPHQHIHTLSGLISIHIDQAIGISLSLIDKNNKGISFLFVRSVLTAVVRQIFFN